ncbi:MAG: hypothetical protein JWO87_44 [Phycisphaerales bacterium]|nr:hypothetical protein [Phycisphaerales bacterium]MDB5298381.1 hypothetical protein [Phycisphaerales bacterium]
MLPPIISMFPDIRPLSSVRVAPMESSTEPPQALGPGRPDTPGGAAVDDRRVRS